MVQRSWISPSVASARSSGTSRPSPLRPAGSTTRWVSSRVTGLMTTRVTSPQAPSAHLTAAPIMNGVCVIATFLACRDPRADPGNPILTYLTPDGIVRVQRQHRLFRKQRDRPGHTARTPTGHGVAPGTGQRGSGAHEGRSVPARLTNAPDMRVRLSGQWKHRAGPADGHRRKLSAAWSGPADNLSVKGDLLD